MQPIGAVVQKGDTLLQIAICDDNPIELDNTRALVAAWLCRHPELDGSLHTFQSGYSLTEYINTQKSFDLYLLDVLMPVQDGIALGHAIRKSDDRAVIVYLTSSSDYAVQSYSVRAFHYLLKPFKAEQLDAILDEFCARYLREQEASFLMRTRDGMMALPIAELCSAELRNHTAICHMADGRVLISRTLRGSFDQFIEPLLHDKRFLKIGASYAVNLSFVTSLSGREFLLKNGSTVLIPRSALLEVRNAYVSYLFERGRG